MSTDLTLENAIGQKLIVAFMGREPAPELLSLLRRRHVGGLSLFRSMNADDPQQVRRLTTALQKAAQESGQPPLLIAADLEGGTLQAIPGLTPFPGNMALGATGSADLARRQGRAIGTELAAVGVNVNYAPVVDVNNNPQNPVVSTRSFGADPGTVARLGAALVEGLQQAGVAATPKHFPGHGDIEGDSHYGLPVAEHDAERLRHVELPPFRAAIEAGARLVMTAHIALPAFSGQPDLPATLSIAVMRDLLRRELGFEGVIISDAMNMQAIEQGPGLVVDTIAAAAAGVDLLLLIGDEAEQETLYSALLQATRRGLLDANEMQESARRVLELKSWLARQEQPPLSVIGSAEHQALAREIAAGALTLVRDNAGLLPLKLAPEARILAIVPQPEDLTPADTSSYETVALAEALRRYHGQVDEVTVPLSPGGSEIAGLRQRARDYDLIVVATINAFSYPAQASMVQALLDSGVPVVAVAMRLPYDVEAYPAAPAYIATYSIQRPSLEALADALWGQAPFPGKLPVELAVS